MTSDEAVDLALRGRDVLEQAGIDPDIFLRVAAPMTLGIRVCRACGCTDMSACDDGCYWVEDDLCSACERS